MSWLHRNGLTIHSTRNAFGVRVNSGVRALGEISVKLRVAKPSDKPSLSQLIELSGRVLSIGFYSAEQAEALVRHVFGVDSQLIEDQTYFVIEEGNTVAACGGWSKRRTLFGGDQAKSGPDPLLDPNRDAARIRAFFVSPLHARKGLGRQLTEACVAAARQAGFARIELAATLPGEPFYLALGFHAVERFEIDLPGNIRIPLVRMFQAI